MTPSPPLAFNNEPCFYPFLEVDGSLDRGYLGLTLWRVSGSRSLPEEFRWSTCEKWAFLHMYMKNEEREILAVGLMGNLAS